MDLIDKAAQLNISHFTVHDFVDEIDSLREQLASVEKERDGYRFSTENNYKLYRELLKVLLEQDQELASMTKERDAYVSVTADMRKQLDELTIALANCANRAKQVGWKQGDSGYAAGLEAIAEMEKAEPVAWQCKSKTRIATEYVYDKQSAKNAEQLWEVIPLFAHPAAPNLQNFNR